ncbi:nicotinamide riboside transporter 1 [[Candida] railenensis]|uniref:Nicotinamide riboside transporter 1 n=1 Tax=[Candida] railenensis TaxID=45579 RepID=A0A9P0QTV1_9ASCO|nr:nicotinamide riboside transporter 1 [[Candida] railenensis]
MLQRYFDYLKVKEGDGVQKITYLRNKDIIPMGPERRIWGVWSLTFYWSITNVTISTWSGASSLLSLGLSVGETMGIILIGNIIIATLALLNAAPGGYYHIGYTISQRVVFGIRGSWVGIIIRIILSIVWFGSQAYLGSLCLSCVFASWSKSYLNMKNTIPDSVNMTTQQLVGFVIFQLISIPPLFVKPERFNKALIVSCSATFFAMLGITIWTVARNGGSNGPLMNESGDMSSSTRGWAWMYGISSWYGSLSSGVANQSDFTRFSKKTWSSLYGTIFSLVVVGTVIPLMGLISASAMKGRYGIEIWRPDEIIMYWLDEDYSATSRAAAFFCGLVFTVSQITFNTMGNGYAGGMDLAGILPKYVTIRRGAIITALFSWVVQPWDFYNTSSTFVTVMSSFSVFMSPIVGIIISDFWIIRKKHIKLSHLYTDDPSGKYWYWKGVNYRNLIIWIICFAPGLPGLVNSANSSLTISPGAKKFYYGNTLFEFAMAFFMTYVTSLVWPYKDIEEVDSFDYFATWTDEECAKLNIVPYSKITKNDIEIDPITSVLSSEQVIILAEESIIQKE